MKEIQLLETLAPKRVGECHKLFRPSTISLQIAPLKVAGGKEGRTGTAFWTFGDGENVAAPDDS